MKFLLKIEVLKFWNEVLIEDSVHMVGIEVLKIQSLKYWFWLRLTLLSITALLLALKIQSIWFNTSMRNADKLGVWLSFNLRDVCASKWMICAGSYLCEILIKSFGYSVVFLKFYCLQCSFVGLEVWNWLALKFSLYTLLRLLYWSTETASVLTMNAETAVLTMNATILHFIETAILHCYIATFFYRTLSVTSFSAQRWIPEIYSATPCLKLGGCITPYSSLVI